MPSKEILQEAQNLREVCTRLELVADSHDHLTEKLLAISKTVQNAAILLELLVVTKLDGSRPM